MGRYQTIIAGGGGEAKARWTLHAACYEFRGLMVELMKRTGRVRRTDEFFRAASVAVNVDLRLSQGLTPCSHACPGVTNYKASSEPDKQKALAESLQRCLLD
jgi:hypothetical protein